MGLFDFFKNKSAGEVVEKAEEIIEEKIEDLEDTAEEIIERIEDKAEDFIEAVEDKAEEIFEPVEEKIEEIVEKAEEIVEEAPKKGFFAKLKEGLGKTRKNILLHFIKPLVKLILIRSKKRLNQ